MRSLLKPGERRKQFENAARLERSYVDDNANFKWCPAADCGRAIRAPKGQLGVKCKCSHRWCFTCNDADHLPASCAELKKWLVKCRDDSETFNWLVSNTKPCPKCATSIEKSGGCNHSEMRPAPRRTRHPHRRTPHGAPLTAARAPSRSDVQERLVQVRLLLGVSGQLEGPRGLVLQLQQV